MGRLKDRIRRIVPIIKTISLLLGFFVFCGIFSGWPKIQEAQAAIPNFQAAGTKATGTTTASADWPTQDNLQPQENQGIAEKPKFQGKSQMRGYTYDLKRLLEQARENVKKIDKELNQAEIKEPNEKKDIKAMEYFEIGDELYQEGEKEIGKEPQKTLETSQGPGIKGYIRKSEMDSKQK